MGHRGKGADVMVHRSWPAFPDAHVIADSPMTISAYVFLRERLGRECLRSQRVSHGTLGFERDWLRGLKENQLRPARCRFA
jgi:hypothetical protein